MFVSDVTDSNRGKVTSLDRTQSRSLIWQSCVWLLASASCFLRFSVSIIKRTTFNEQLCYLGQIKYPFSLYELVSHKGSLYCSQENTKFYQVRRICSGIPCASLKMPLLYLLTHNKVSSLLDFLKRNQQMSSRDQFIYTDDS